MDSPPRLAEVGARNNRETLPDDARASCSPVIRMFNTWRNEGERMNRLLGMAIGAALLAASPAYSCCLFKCCGKGGGGYGQNSYGAAAAAPCDTPVAAPAAVTYVDQKVITYKHEPRVKQVECTVYTEKWTDQAYEYTVMTPSTRTEKRPVNKCKEEWVDQPYEYTVMKPHMMTEKRPVTKYRHEWIDVPTECTVLQRVTTMEKRKVTSYKQVWEDVPCSHTVMQQVTTMEKRPCTTWVCVPRTVTQTVPVMSYGGSNWGGGYGGKGCCKKGWGGGYGQGAAQECGYQTVCCTVYDRVAQTTMVDCPVTKCVPVVVNSTRKVCRHEPVVTEVDCPVTKCVPVVVKGTRKECKVTSYVEHVDCSWTVCKPEVVHATRKVCKVTPYVEMVDCVIHECKPVTHKATRKVCTMVPSVVKKDVHYTECVAVETIVKVPVCAPNMAYASPYVNAGYGNSYGNRGKGCCFFKCCGK